MTTGSLRLLAQLAILVALPAFSATIRVPADQPTIQAGIGAASPGDTVLVSPGTYTGTGNKNVDFGGKDTVLRSESGAESTIIDCQHDGRGFDFHSGEIPSATVEGFTITNGFTGVSGGAAIICSAASPTIKNCLLVRNQGDLGAAFICFDGSPEITNCVFSQNVGFAGGGIYCASSSSSPIIRDCAFSGNSASYAGGGLYCSDSSSPNIVNCSFTGNTAMGGGGAYVAEATPTFTRCIFTDNRAIHDQFFARGGGMECAFPGRVTLRDCVFTGNYANAGGGIWAWDSATLIIDACRFSRNSAASSGGGLACVGATAYLTGCSFIENSSDAFGGGIYGGGPLLTMARCVFWKNTVRVGGGAVSCDTSPLSIEECTFFDNSAALGSAIRARNVSMERTIIAGGRGGAPVFCDGGTGNLQCCNVFGNEGGDWVECIKGQSGVNGNFSGDPRFCDPETGNFNLTANSPCLPGNHPDEVSCGLIGALGGTCPSGVEQTTWGAIKARFGKTVRP